MITLQQFKSDASKYHYVFIGQNATTGTAHPITGKTSHYGRIISFFNKQDALHFVSEFRSNNPSEFAVAGTVNTLRRYKLGQTWFNYITDLLWIDANSYDENNNLI